MKTEDNTDRQTADQHEGSAKPTEPREHTRSGLIYVISRRRWLLLPVLLLVVTAVVLALIFSRGAGSGAGRPVPAPAGESIPSPSGESLGGARSMPGDITITITPDKLANAQIKLEAATTPTETAAPVMGGVRTTGTVQVNEYKETPVLPIAGGIVRQVNAELGDSVKRGQSLVEYSARRSRMPNPNISRCSRNLRSITGTTGVPSNWLR